MTRKEYKAFEVLRKEILRVIAWREALPDIRGKDHTLYIHECHLKLMLRLLDNIHAEWKP